MIDATATTGSPAPGSSGPGSPRRTGGAAPLPMPARSEERWLLIAIVVSLLLHSGVMLAVRHRNLGTVDPSYLAEPTAVYRMQRAPRDVIVDEPLAADAPTDTAADQTPDKTVTPPERPPLVAAGEQALAAVNLDASPATAKQEDVFQKPEESPPLVEITKPGYTPPKIDLPDTARSSPAVAQAMTSRFIPSTDGGSTAPGAAGVSRSAADAARSLDALAGDVASLGAAGGVTGALSRAAMTSPVPGSPGSSGVPGNPGTPGNGATSPATHLPLPTPVPDALASDKAPKPEILDDDFDYVVTLLEPTPTTPGAPGEDGYARIDVTPKRSLRKLKTMPKDVVYLIDTSGSVPPEWVQQAVRGVRDSLASLNPGDRFNIVLFKDQPEFFSEQAIQPADEATIARAQAFLSGARSGGNTDVNRALSRLLVRDAANDRVYNLVLISDGLPTRGVMDTRGLINLITRDNDQTAGIFCIGVGPRQNRELLNFLAYRNKGFSIFVDDANALANTIRDTMSRLRYPIMKDVAFEVAGLKRGSVHPVNVPDIYQGQTFQIFGRFAALDRFTMRLAGHNGQTPFEFTFTRDLKDAHRGDRALATDWAFWRLHHLYSEMIKTGDSPALRAAIEEMKTKYGLKTLY